jgi:pseudouridine-5'-phosphate glycosidase
MLQRERLVTLDIEPEVRIALARERPVVALESALITHGLPRPDNLEAARTMQRAVREHDAVPAVVAVLRGRLCVGLSDRRLAELAETGGRKLSLRDLPVAVARRETGGTTVAATTWIAAQAGVRVFATGGIGGVHRQSTFDISADLPTLAATQMVVVCSGAKSVLDLPSTLEWLETHGVPVLGYQTDVFPAFFSRDSGLPVDARVESPDDVATIARARWDMGFEGGVLVAVPVPEEAAVPADTLEAAIDQALQLAESHQVRGKHLTPFLLERLASITSGATLRANLALLERNASVAAQIATALCRQQVSIM